VYHCNIPPKQGGNVATSTEGIAYQANFKTGAGSLLNIYATNGAEFAELLVGFEEFIAPIVAIESALTGASNVARAVPVAPAYQQPPTAPAPQPTPGADAVHLCDHQQPMKLIPAGISKASGKPYKAFWACTQPRGMQCDAKVTV
jgi:hypothetical protein